MERTTIDAPSLPDDEALAGFVVRQRWFGSKARPVAGVTIADWVALTTSGGMAFVEVRFEDGTRDDYVLPLATITGDEGAVFQQARPEAIVSRIDAERLWIDGVYDDTVCLALLDMLQEGTAAQTRRGRVLATRVTDASMGDGDVQPIARTAPDQSNTSVIFASRVILKLFRRMESGLNPDVELGVFLTRQGFAHVPRVLASAEYEERGTLETTSIGILQQFVPNRGNGWQVVVADLVDHLEQVGAHPTSSSEQHALPLALPELLGRRTGAMHLALAASDEPNLVAERYDASALASLAAGMRSRAESELQLLASRTDSLRGSVRESASRLVAARDQILGTFDALHLLGDAGLRIRCHGDYHLGQTLVTDDDVFILDFEGEPARSLRERRSKWSPLRDVAGMLRSFSYAAETAVRQVGEARQRDDGGLGAAASHWERAAESVFLRTYFQTVETASLLPRDDHAVRIFLRAFIVDKAAYELGYEMNNRPDWVAIPVAGLERLLEPPAKT